MTGACRGVGEHGSRRGKPCVLVDFGPPRRDGVRVSIWAENLAREELVEYMALPRLLALAERAWSPEADWEQNSAQSLAQFNNRWSIFVNVLGKKELPRLDVYRGGYGYHIPYPGAAIENGNVVMNIETPGFDIRYTTDGSEPTVNSTRYEGPIKTRGVIKARAFSRNGRGSVVIVVSNL